MARARVGWPLALTLAVALAASGLAAPAEVPRGAPFAHEVRRGPGVTSERWLSAWLPALDGTPGDTRVYVLEGAEPGGTVVVAGGTHGNEIAGIMAATLLVERARVAKGRLIVIPNANNSAVSATDPQRPGPEWIELKTAGGTRRFKYGARRTRPEHQGAPDPERYRHPASEESLDGDEARNLDRVYPGDPAGTLTQRIAAAIMRLLVQEKADLAFDLHEAGPESRLAWMIVANPKNLDLGALAVLKLDEAGIPMKLEPSSAGFRGLSHREWGDATPARAFLFETPNPGQVEEPTGADVVDHPDYPLTRRVGVHLSALQAILEAYASEAPAEPRVELRELPALADLLRRGLGAFLQPAAPAPAASPVPAASPRPSLSREDASEHLFSLALRVARQLREGAGIADAGRAEALRGVAIGERLALIGAELTPLVTTAGSLESKLLATDPRWSRLLVQQLAARGVGPGRPVVASFSGSFPGLNLAVMAAARSLDAPLLAVSSVTASTWGANEPGLTWPQIEAAVVAAGVLPPASAAVSLGGTGDAARDLSPEGRELARRIQSEAARSLGAVALRTQTLREAIAARLAVYRSALDGRRPAVYVNVGGNHASLGGARAPLRHDGGWLTSLPEGATADESVMHAWLAEGVPVLNLLELKALAREWGLEGGRL